MLSERKGETKLNYWERALVMLLSALAVGATRRNSVRAFSTTARRRYTFRATECSRIEYFPSGYPHACHFRRRDRASRTLSNARYLSSSPTTDRNETNATNYAGLTVQETLLLSLSYLQESNAPEPESSVVHLLAFVLDLPWSDGFVLLRQVLESNNTELATRVLTKQEAELLQQFLSRRVDMEPLQYILGKWDFLDYTFRIQPPLLCPRPETEELVLKVNDDIQHMNQEDIRILDVGCGTGVIGVSLAAMLGDDKANVTSLDIDPVAVDTTSTNAEAILGTDNAKHLFRAMLYSASNYERDGSTPPFDVIVSNPPYIPQHDMMTLSQDVVEYESHGALCGGIDGMNVIRDIIHNAPEWGRSGTILWMEVDPTHPALIKQWLGEEECGSIGIVYDSTHTDLYGRDRFVKLRVT